MVDLDSVQTTTQTSAPRGSDRPRRTWRFVIPGVVVAAAAVVVVVFVTRSSTSPRVSANQLVQQGLQAQAVGKTTEALSDFQSAIAKDPTNTFAYYDLGVLYQQRLNQPAVAATEYRKAILANPGYKPALFNLAILETQTDPPGAIDLYNQLLRMNPNDANVTFNLGLLLIAQNQQVPGHADLKRAIQLNPALASRVPAGITP
jgi:tetratricopeptide (TPR) repeat protein